MNETGHKAKMPHSHLIDESYRRNSFNAGQYNACLPQYAPYKPCPNDGNDDCNADEPLCDTSLSRMSHKNEHFGLMTHGHDIQQDTYGLVVPVADSGYSLSRNESISLEGESYSKEVTRNSPQGNALLLKVPPEFSVQCDRRKDFIDLISANCVAMRDEDTVFSKLPGYVYLFNPTTAVEKMISQYLVSNFGSASCGNVKCTRPELKDRANITDEILSILKGNQSLEMQYTDLMGELGYALTIDLPIDYGRLVEVNRKHLHGIRMKHPAAHFAMATLPKTHLLRSISIRKLSPLVHNLLEESQNIFHGLPITEVFRTAINIAAPHEGKNNVACLLDQTFLLEIADRIDRNYSKSECTKVPGRNHNSSVIGEGEPKPLEHLIACVPGVEVIWINRQKYIRKLEHNKSDCVNEMSPTKPVVRQCPAKTNKKEKKEDKNQTEQKITKIVSSILKDVNLQYVDLRTLECLYMRHSNNLGIPVGLRDFIIEHVKHFQILGEGDDEFVTLSHRAQIKRICNDITRLLRRRNPKSISSAELPSQLIELWQNSRDTEVLDVSQYGVCFLDDLLVTIPQHWGVHCSVYVSSNNGQLMQRRYGPGEEDVPAFIKLDNCVRPPGSPVKKQNRVTLKENPREGTNGQWDLEGYSMVHIWMPIHQRTPFQQKQSAFIKQQILNMFRGDPTAAELMNILQQQIILLSSQGPEVSIENRNKCAEMFKRLDSICSRSNRPSDLLNNKKRNENLKCNGKENPNKHHVPLDFEIEFNQFIPTFHHVSNAQASLENYGAKTLFELFDNMADTFILTHHEANNAKIRLTAEARRDVLERRLIYLLRKENRRLLTHELMHRYRTEPTMAPFYDECEIERALRECNLIDVHDEPSGVYIAIAKQMFSLEKAIEEGGPDVAVVLSIFMTSFTPLTLEELKNRFESREHRPFPVAAFIVLRDHGALRKTKLHNSSLASTQFDLQDICRTVRNIIFQMSDAPREAYYVLKNTVYFERVCRGNRNEGLNHSINHLLEFSGDCTQADFDINKVMRDFYPFFEPIGAMIMFGESAPVYKLNENLIAGEPSAEEKDKLNKKKEKKGNTRLPPSRAMSPTILLQSDQPHLSYPHQHNQAHVCRPRTKHLRIN